jgi:hypothetical protein
VYTMSEYRIPLHDDPARPQLSTWVVLDGDGAPVTYHSEADEAAWRTAWHVYNRERLVAYRVRANERLTEEMKEYHT